jgi:hypothetical protein
VDISYFESGYIDPKYFTTVYDGESLLEVFASELTTAGTQVDVTAILTSSFTTSASGYLSIRISSTPIAITATNTGGASSFDGISAGAGRTEFSYFGDLKIDAGPLVEV